MPPDWKAYEKPGAARAKARQAWQEAVDAKVKLDQANTIENVGAYVRAQEKFAAARREALEEVDQGYTDGEGAAVVAGFESDSAFYMAPRDALRQEVEVLLSDHVAFEEALAAGEPDD